MIIKNYIDLIQGKGKPANSVRVTAWRIVNVANDQPAEAGQIL